ncbi:putative anaphase-promoting complex subunit Apc5 [Patellaria atrata CBS 101060]|uniref:Anaphase-promoting complex subunit 5 n=1 Tax=Patellaria atrata CBS 101060 TaxID=1346257 RepID=A0A9P4VRN2_9PEZI|nr:putative anaphase-promoting complex subunit Apc5 [Patellaria atrata CBS 101060]
MTRYLTPQKIGLLCLISLYCDGVVPSVSVIPVLSFILSHLEVAQFSSGKSKERVIGYGFFIPIRDFENLTMAHSSSVPGRTLFDLFLNKLWSINSLDSLHSFFDDLEQYLAKGRNVPHDVDNSELSNRDRILLSRTSPCGAYVRRAQLEFTRLQFDDAIKLWAAFFKYREPTTTAWKRRHPGTRTSVNDASIQDLDNSHDLFSIAMANLDIDDDQTGLVAADDIEAILDFQVQRLQRLGNRIPDEMKSQFRKMLTPSVATPSLLHFVRFFDAWRAGDYTSAFDNLHRYFDYTMHNRDKSYYHYALLHMAILHADFGCFDEAIATMSETIATARENQDLNCLNFSLSWLNHLNKAYPKRMKGTEYGGMIGSEREGIAFLKAKARESKNYALLSSTLLSEAKLRLSNGDTAPKALEQLFQSSHLNITHRITNNFGTQLLMLSALYGRIGLQHLSTSYCDLILDCYRDHSPVEEALRAICRNAFTAAQAGRFTQAMSIFQSIDPDVHRTLKFHQYLISFSGLLKLRRALRRSDITAISHLLLSLRAGCASDPDLLFQFSLLEIEHRLRQQDFPLALRKIEDVNADLENADTDIYQRIHLLILKAQLWAKVDRPELGFSLAMRAAALSWRSRILPALWEALGLVVGILNEMGECEAARGILASTIPHAIECGDLALVAHLHGHMATAHIGLAGKYISIPSSSPSTPSRATTPDFSPPVLTHLSRAEFFLDNALECYTHLEDVEGQCECLMKKSIVARVRGDEGVSEDWAQRYLDTRRKAEEEFGEDRGEAGMRI